MTNRDSDVFKKVSDVQVKYIDQLMAMPNVVGVAVGLVQKEGEYTDEVGLVVMVSEKVPLEDLAEEDVIPEELDGVTVDVQETGLFSAS